MSLFYSYIAGSLHVSGPQAHLQESSYSCSHNHWFSFCAALFACSLCCGLSWQSREQSPRQATTRRAREQSDTETVRNNGCVNSCTNSPEDGPVGPKHVEIQQYTNKIVRSVCFHSLYNSFIDTNLIHNFLYKLHKIKFLYMFRAPPAFLQEVSDINCTCMQPLVFC